MSHPQTTAIQAENLANWAKLDAKVAAEKATRARNLELYGNPNGSSLPEGYGTN